MSAPEFIGACPLPLPNYPNVLLAHGGGGKLMHDLIGQVFLPAFSLPRSKSPHDSAVFNVGQTRLAFTTDSYVVRPLVFPGGDIGSMAVHGTVNDLAMAGARPLVLSAAFIIEEGFPLTSLQQLTDSMANAAATAQVRIVTGDTKIVEQGKGDGVFINTAGIGVIEHDLVIAPEAIQPGDVVLLSGDVGRHGITILAAREGLAFETNLESDSAPLASPVLALLRDGVTVHCLRDITRGGLTAVLNELAEGAQSAIEVEENLIPVREDVKAVCEVLGLDALQVACEGRFLAVLPAAETSRALQILREHAVTSGARLVGRVLSGGKPRVFLKSSIGTTRVLDMPSGEQLPRIC